VQVQRYLHAALEVFVGFHRDSVFGPLVTVGLGGRLLEPLQAVRHWALPIERSTLHGSLRATLLGQLVEDIASDAVLRLVYVVSDLGEYFLGRPSLTELDVNPVLFDASGQPWIIDAAAMESAGLESDVSARVASGAVGTEGATWQP
jgi:hypothetical protein